MTTDTKIFAVMNFNEAIKMFKFIFNFKVDFTIVCN